MDNTNTLDTIEQVSSIKYILKEEYSLDSNEIDTIIDQCKWSLHQALETINSHLSLNKNQDNIHDKQTSLLQVLTIEENE